MEYVVQPTNIPLAGYIASQVTLNVVTAGFVCIRFGTNWKHAHRLFADDYLCVMAILWVSSYSATSSMMNRTYNHPAGVEISVAFITRLAAACIFTATTAMYFAKLPILFLYLRLFGSQRWLRVICYIILVVTALTFLGCAIYTGVHCSPRHKILNEPYLLGCVGSTLYSTVVRNIISLIADMVILLLPLPIIVKLHLPFHRKLGLACVFMAGSFALVAGGVSLYYQWAQNHATSANVTNAMLATVTECCIAIIVSCAPALQVFWSHYLKESSFVKRFSSSNPVSSSKKAGQSLRNSLNRRPEPIHVTTHHYIELHETNAQPLASQCNAGGNHVASYEARASTNHH